VGGVGVAANDEAIALKEVRYETVGTDLKISALVG